MAASPSHFPYESINWRIPQYVRSAIRAYAAGIMAGPSCPPNGLLLRLCAACGMDYPARRSWSGERGAKGSIQVVWFWQRGSGNNTKAPKASPSWHMFNQRVLHHRCAHTRTAAASGEKMGKGGAEVAVWSLFTTCAVPSPATKRSTAAVGQKIT